MCGLFLATIVPLGIAQADEILFVPADGTIVTSSMLESGQLYRIRAEGTYDYSWDDLPADAEWHLRQGQTVWEEDFWDYGGGFYIYEELDLLINDIEYDWLGTTNGINFAPHTYSPSHVYILDFMGAGEEISLYFYIQDIEPGDNSGQLTVTISEIPEPTTLILLGLGGLIIGKKRPH